MECCRGTRLDHFIVMVLISRNSIIKILVNKICYCIRLKYNIPSKGPRVHCYFWAVECRRGTRLDHFIVMVLIARNSIIKILGNKICYCIRLKYNIPSKGPRVHCYKYNIPSKGPRVHCYF